jgi:outer membrane protein assembly factor BamB
MLIPRTTAAAIIRVAAGVVFLSCKCEKLLSPEGRDSLLVWSYAIPFPFSEDVQPVIENGKTYVVSDTSISCFELATGKRLWTNALGISGGVFSAKLLHAGGVLFLNHTGWVKAFDKQTGSLLWKADINPASVGASSQMSQDQTHLFLGRKGFVLRIQKSTGAIDLTIQVDSLVSPPTLQDAHNPVVSDFDNYLYVTTVILPTKQYPAFKGNVFCYNRQTGDYVWGFPIPNRKILLPGLPDSTILDAGARGCAIQDSFIVFPAGESIYALDRFTGTLKWTKDFTDDSFGAGAVIQGNTIYVGSQAGASVYAIDLATAQILWRTKTQGSIFNLLTVLDNRVYLCNGLDGQIWVFNSSNGNVIWRSFPPEYPGGTYYYLYSSNLAVGEGYMVDVGSRKVYCLRTP